MRLVVLSFAALCCAAPTSGGQAPEVKGQGLLSLTEREAVSRVMAGSPRLRSLAAQVDEVRASQAERTLWPNPSATYTRESAGNAHDTFLLGHQEIPINGRRGRLQEAGHAAVEAAQADARFEALQLQADVRDAYGQLLIAQEREKIVRQSIDTLQQLIGMLRAREKDGEGSTYDRMRGERALVDLDAELALAATARIQAAGLLAAYLASSVTPESIVAVDQLLPTPQPTQVPVLIEQALANRQDYRATQFTVTRFDTERAAASRLKIPTPTLTGGLKRSETLGNSSSGYQFSVDLALPLVNRGTTAVALAEAQRARAAADADALRMRISAEVAAAHRVLTIQHERAARYRESAATVAEPLAKIGRVAYEEGEVGILELLDAERQALDARLRVLEFAAAVRRAAIDLDRVIGEELKP